MKKRRQSREKSIEIHCQNGKTPKNLAKKKSLDENGFLCDDEKSQKQAIFNFVAQNNHELACLRIKIKIAFI